jgi:hypothetical protein
MAKETMELDVPTDEDLFNEAEKEVAEEPKAEEAPKEAEAEVEATAEQEDAGRERDEQGRFKAKEEGGEHHRVPLKELLDEREKRQQVQQQFEAMQQHMAEQQAWQEQQAYAQQAEQQAPDIFENPEYYQQTIAGLPQYLQELGAQYQQQVNQQLAMQRHEIMGEFSLQQAKREDPDTFNAAWSALEQRVQAGDNTWRHQVLTSSDPGSTLVSFYKKDSVGDDPDAYVNSRIEELKKDPKFLSEVLEAAQQMSGQNSPAPRINMPSLNKAGGTGTSMPMGINQNDLWDEINR